MGVDKRDELPDNAVAPQPAAQPVHLIDSDFQALRASEHALRKLVQNLPGMIVAYDQSGYLRFVNSRVIEYFGEDPSDRAGFAWGDYVHADDSEGLRDAWLEGMRAPREMNLSYRLRRADGTYRWFECRVQPVFNDRQEVLHWYGLLTDVDDRRIAEANLQEPSSLSG
jgi:PAS domain S-box-containing protein